MIKGIICGRVLGKGLRFKRKVDSGVIYSRQIIKPKDFILICIDGSKILVAEFKEL